MCNLNVIVVLEYISRDLYLLFAKRFYSKFQNSVFCQYMRPKSGLKSPRPLFTFMKYCTFRNVHKNFIFVNIREFVASQLKVLGNEESPLAIKSTSMLIREFKNRV